MTNKSRGFQAALRTSTALLGLSLAALAMAPAGAVVTNNAYTPTQAIDTGNTTFGVGQMVIDQQNGYIGLCTATLINPRTVIFAAHCVNENADGDGFKDPATYGSKFGGTPIGFFFNVNNNVSGNSAIGHWLNGVSGGAKDLTRTAEYAYNSNYVTYHPNSIALGVGNNFYEGDIAIAALDTPATNIPSWTLLFSPLTSPTHATITGYGKNGTGTVGSANNIDYRRRVAENMISMLGSLDDIDTVLFGAPDGLPQNLYFSDFNDPNYGTANANRYDFNIFHDAALAKEGITASGDSGGPLIVDQAFNKQVVAAVLSGGTRYYSRQPSSAYGTTSFYQPLYLYWDWIVVNNPYKYVSAKAGDGSWTDPTHWVMNIDPNYVSIVNGELSNTLPTTPAQGLPSGSNVNSPKFGQVCYFNDCVDIVTGKETIYSTDGSAEGLSAETGASPAQVLFTEGDIASDTSAAPASTVVGDVLRQLINYELGATMAGSAAEGSALINGVMIQGAPGSSNFVPNDTDGDPATGAPPRYYDVTLSADGTTTLSGATVVIDRLTINGAKTGLTIASGAALGTLIDTTVYAGNFRVDGTYVSAGDIALLGGILSGTGKVSAPYTTAVVGAIAPGTIGTAGTLTMQGSVVLSSGSTFLIDVGPATNDLLAVSGTVNLGGTAVVSPAGGYVPRYHDKRTVITASAITGSFTSVPDTVPGVLYPVLETVGGTAEVLTFEAASFSTVLTSMTADQAAIGGLLDTDRADYYGDISGLYDAIDPLTDTALATSLENLAPDAARATTKLTQLVTDAYTSYLWQYLDGISADSDGRVAVDTSALKLMQNAQSGSLEMRSLLANLGGAANTAGASPLPASAGGMELPKGLGAFLTGQKLDGIVTIGGSGGKADVDGYLIGLGLDYGITPTIRAGLSVAYSDVAADLRNTPSRVTSGTWQFVAYGNYANPMGYFVSGYVGGLAHATSTYAIQQVGGTSFATAGHTHGGAPLFGVQAGWVFENVAQATVKPAIGLQYGEQQNAGYTESGSPAAMSYAFYRAHDTNLRVGFDAKWNLAFDNFVLKPSLHLFSVTSIDNKHPNVVAGFAVDPTTTAAFAVSTPSKSWVETGIGLEADLCQEAVLGFHFNANPGRGEASYQSFGGNLKVKF